MWAGKQAGKSQASDESRVPNQDMGGIVWGRPLSLTCFGRCDKHSGGKKVTELQRGADGRQGALEAESGGAK